MVDRRGDVARSSSAEAVFLLALGMASNRCYSWNLVFHARSGSERVPAA